MQKKKPPWDGVGWVVEESDDESGDETKRGWDERKKVEFAAHGVQWHERQRRPEDFDLRMGKVCGKNYDGR